MKAPKPARLVRVFATVTLLSLMGCTAELPAAGGQICEPGASTACTCADGRPGIRLCNQDGASWSSCGACGTAQPLGQDSSLPPHPEGGPITPTGPDGGPITDAQSTDLPPGPAGPTPISLVAWELDRHGTELEPYKPFYPYGWVSNPVIQQGRYDQEIQSLTALPASMPKWLIYSCYSDANAKLSDASHLQQLKQAGVYAIGINTEGDKTCGSEFQNMTQTVVNFATLATAKGLSSIWGPIRMRLDSTSDADYGKMFSAGLTGVALQEQNQLGSQGCVQERLAKLNALSKRMDQIAGRHIELHVQIMARQCKDAESMCGGSGNYSVCHDFVKQLQGVADTIGIWTIGEQDTIVPFVTALRAP